MTNVEVVEGAALTRREAVLLEGLEATIAGGMRSFVAVGEALAKVRDERLFRAAYPTFEAYARDRWGWGRTVAYRYIEAAEVQANVVTSLLPTVEHGHMLAAFSPDQQRDLAPAIAELTVREARKVVQQARDAETLTTPTSKAARKELRSILADDDGPDATAAAFVKAADAMAEHMAQTPTADLKEVGFAIVRVVAAYRAVREERKA